MPGVLENKYQELKVKQDKFKQAEFKRNTIRNVPLFAISLIPTVIIASIIGSFVFPLIEYSPKNSSAMYSSIIMFGFYIFIGVIMTLNYFLVKLEDFFPNFKPFLVYSQESAPLKRSEKTFLLLMDCIKILEEKERGQLKLKLAELIKRTKTDLKYSGSFYCKAQFEKLLELRKDIETISDKVACKNCLEDDQTRNLIKNYLEKMASNIINEIPLLEWRMPELKTIEMGEEKNDVLPSFFRKNKLLSFIIVYLVLVIPLIFLLPPYLAAFLPYQPDNILLALATLFSVGGVAGIFVFK